MKPTSTAIAIAGAIAFLGAAAAAGVERSVEMSASSVVAPQTAPQIATGPAGTRKVFPPPFDTSRISVAKLPSSGKS